MSKDDRDDAATRAHGESETRAVAKPIPIDRNQAYSAMKQPAPHTYAPTINVAGPVSGTHRLDDLADGAGESPGQGRSQSWPAPQFDAAPTGRLARHPETGVHPGPFLGAVAVTSVIVALVVAVLAWVVKLIVRAVPESYWGSAAITPPTIELGLYIWSAIAANLLFAGLLFGLIKLAIAPVGRWFRLITTLLTLLVVVAVISAGGPWQHVLPTAIVIGVCGFSMSTWCRAYGQRATINRGDF